MPEALVAATINAAASVGKAHTQGSIEVGKMADFIIIDAPRYALLHHVHLSQTSKLCFII
jgi:imidazolonepropionase